MVADLPPTGGALLEAVAERYWLKRHRSMPADCHGKIVLERTNALPDPSYRVNPAWAATWDCTITWHMEVIASYPWRDKCRVMVHEWGHITGLGHAPGGGTGQDPRARRYPVMGYPYDVSMRPCDSRKAALAYVVR